MALNLNGKSQKMDFDEIVFGGNGNAIFYKVALEFAFRESRSFEVINGIEIPSRDNDGSVVLSFDDGGIGYFKVQSRQLSDEEFESLLDVCYFLQDSFGGSIDAYVLCLPEIEMGTYGGIMRDGVSLRLEALDNYDGDEIVEKLEAKRKNRARFTFRDCIHHILLPYMGYRDRDVFLPKYQHYMMETLFGNAEKHGIEVFRL